MKIRSLFAAAMIVSSSAAFAAPIPIDVTVNAVIPSDTGLDVHDVTGWSASPMTMVYERTSKTLGTVGGPVSIKGGTTAVKAYLVSAPEMVSGGESIPLTVKVGTFDLAVGSTASVEVVSAADVVAGKQVQFVIGAGTVAGGYKEGNYQGIVRTLFESAP